MTAYSGSTSEGFLPTLNSGSTPTANAVPPAPDDPSATFHDFLRQQASGNTGTNAPASSASTGADSSADATTPASATGSDTPAAGFFATGFPAAKLPPPTSATTVPPPNAPSDESASPAPATTTPPVFGLTRFSPLFDGTPPASAQATAATTTPADLSTESDTPALPFGSPLTTLLARAALLANTRQPATGNTSATTAASTATPSATSSLLTLPLFQGFGKAAHLPASTEKKSASSPTERSFIQSRSNSSTTPDASAMLLAGVSFLSPQPITPQPLASSVSGAGKSLGEVTAGAATAAGTMNDKKNVDMNASLEMSNLVVSTGTNPLVTKTSADVHILLGTNHDFTEAIDQVVHVAELSNLSRTSNPLRVAIEIQTPPGAIVNVYVSRQADSSYRAQLSTSDVQALGWVQDQIGSLKTSTGSGADIRWAPAQLDVGAATATLGSSSSGSDRNLDWNRGGNPGGNQSSDEQPSRKRNNPAPGENDEPEYGMPFLETLDAIGSAA